MFLKLLAVGVAIVVVGQWVGMSYENNEFNSYVKRKDAYIR